MKPCPLHPEVGVLLIDPRPMGGGRFERSHAFAVYGDDVEYPFMVIDQRLFEKEWFTDDHLLVIMAHELGHILTGSADEEQADKVGLDLLREQGWTRAVALYEREICNRRARGHYARGAVA